MVQKNPFVMHFIMLRTRLGMNSDLARAIFTQVRSTLNPQPSTLNPAP